MDQPVPLNRSFSRRQKIVLLGLAGLGLIAATLVLSAWLPPAIDWRFFFRPAAHQLLQGHSPYDIVGFPIPFWILIPITPLAVLPEEVGRALFLLLNFAAFFFVAYRLKAKPLALAFFSFHRLFYIPS